MAPVRIGYICVGGLSLIGILAIGFGGPLMKHDDSGASAYVAAAADAGPSRDTHAATNDAGSTDAQPSVSFDEWAGDSAADSPDFARDDAGSGDGADGDGGNGDAGVAPDSDGAPDSAGEPAFDGE